MISLPFEMQRAVYWTSVTTCFVLLAVLCCCNGVLHHETVKMADPLRSTSESSSTPDTTGQPETVAVDLGSLLDAGDAAVVTLVAGGTRLAAHRAVLAAGSSVLAAMLHSGTQEDNSSEVNIPDVEGPVLRQLVAFLYTGRAPQQPGTGLKLLAAAEKYGVSALKDTCEQLMSKQLSVENAAAAAVLAERRNCHSLRQAAIAFIKDHFEVMATRGWAEAVHNHPSDLVKFTRLLANTSATNTADSTATTMATTPASPTAAETTLTPKAAPTTPSAATWPHSDHGWTAATDPLPTAGQKTRPPDAATVSQLRSLSGHEKSRRLIRAAQEGAVEDVRALLAAGADVGAGDRNRWTALHAAAYYGHTAVVRLLLAAAADPNARDGYGGTPLHDAALSGHAQVAAALLEAGADRRATNRSGQTAVDVARERNHSHLIQMLS